MTEENNKKWSQFESKMKLANISVNAIDAFEYAYKSLLTGKSGNIAENDLSPATDLDSLTDIKSKTSSFSKEFHKMTLDEKNDLLNQTVVVKLNGGLGTSMGLDKAKSLLTVKNDSTFLDLMAQQTLYLQKQQQTGEGVNGSSSSSSSGTGVKFVLMNSFSTSADTMDFLEKKYPQMVATEDMKAELEMMQNMVPKVNASTMEPAEWTKNTTKEWCPPGHGDLYPSLVGSGKLKTLLAQGVKYMFVSNSDNLGATLDMELLAYFAKSDKSFLMECCERTENDKKGGHLATRKTDGRLILRESAQCAKEDEKHFQNIKLHRYFNTNNLWIRLDHLSDELTKSNGVIKLPMIKNSKTVDPKDATSTAVFQLETAMGAAIECFAGSSAVCVPRNRFAPVKKTDDLLMLRSDAYELTPDFRPILSPKCLNAPIVSLDSKHFKLVQQLEAALVGKDVPSLVQCSRLTVKGPVAFASNVIFVGDVTVVNESAEVKTILPGTYKDMIVNLTENPGLGPLKISHIPTLPIDGQKPGTSGLRKKTKTFMEGHYLHNFIQSCFNSISPTELKNGTVVISGDGRYYNPEAIQILIQMAVAAGVTSIWIGQNGLLSTPAVSAVIREREGGFIPFGGFILSASHNPGGPTEDFGIKYNGANGGPAPESVTEMIYEHTKSVTSYAIASDFPIMDLSQPKVTTVTSDDKSRQVTVQVFDCTEDHVTLLKSIFDFKSLSQLIARKDFSLVYDSMHGVNGPYAHAIFVKELGGPESYLINGVPKDDFNGGHADPNLTYAKDLVKAMGVDSKGQPVIGGDIVYPSFGAAADGDADRNMILGTQFFVTPSDSLAIIAANAANCIPYFKTNGLKAVARSMPTSGAVDLVAAKLGLLMFEVPTGWKFFGNLMDSAVVYGKQDYTPFICGEESFGTGSDHIREKDGMWAVLAWLSIIAAKNEASESDELITVEKIVTEHWKTYGRNYYCRYDYEGVDKAGAEAMMAYMATSGAKAVLSGIDLNGFELDTLDEFTYEDPVDGSISSHQGIRFIFTDKSRVVFRLSGTGVAGATVRMYVEKYEAPEGNLVQLTSDALGPLISVGLALSKLESYVKRKAPTVIT